MNKTMVLSQVANYTFMFGKYKGEKISDAYQVDKKYCEWLYDELDNDNQTKMAMKLICPGIDGNDEENIDTAKVLDLQAEKLRRGK